jgi:hypothetical protein
MRSHRQAVRRLRRLALGLAAIAVVAPSSALAMPAGDAPPSPPPAKIGDTPADFAAGARYTALADHYASSAGKKAGDTPADFPGASGAPEYQAPTTIEVVRPEQTVVRDVDETLPIVLGGAAMLVALGGTGFTLVRMRGMQRRLSH